MTDYWHRITNWLDHHRGTALGLSIAGGMCVWLAGCEVKTVSLFDADRAVTRPQFEGEIRTARLELEQQGHAIDAALADYQAKVQHLDDAAVAGLDDLHRKEQHRQQIIEALGGFAADAVAGTMNPAGAVGAIFSLMSLGAAAGLGADTLRKNRVIRDLKSSAVDASRETGASAAPPRTTSTRAAA